MYKRGLRLKQLEWLAFVIVMIILFFSTQTYFGTASYSRVYNINTYCIIAFLSFSIYINHGNLRYKKIELFSYGVVLLPYLGLLCISLLYYKLYHRITFSHAIYYNMQPILLCSMAIIVFNSFGKKALRGILIAAAINYTVYIVTCMVKYGPLSLFQAGSDSAASKLLEVHEITFIFGLIVVYFLISRYFRKSQIKKRWIVFATVFCLLGFKRILIAAMILVLLLYQIFKRKKKPTAIIVFSVLFIAFTLVWVYLCSSWAVLTNLSAKFGINLMGRNWIYSNFYPYYKFSVSYIGAGIGYVQQLIGELSTMVLNGHSIGLHNDFLRLYIELGCIPYIVYFVILIPVIIYLIYKKLGMKSALNYFVLWMFTLICIATDNLLTYPNYMLTFFIVIITSINEDSVYKEKGERNLVRKL